MTYKLVLSDKGLVSVCITATGALSLERPCLDLVSTLSQRGACCLLAADRVLNSCLFLLPQTSDLSPYKWPGQLISGSRLDKKDEGCRKGETSLTICVTSYNMEWRVNNNYTHLTFSAAIFERVSMHKST